MTAHRLPHLAQRLFNAPIAILPDKAEIIMAALADRFGIARLFSGGAVVPLNRPGAFDEDYDRPARNESVGYDVTKDGIAVVPICGTLVHRLGCVRPYSGLTGYDGIRHNVLSALADPAIRGVMLDIDSPGGEVAGCFDLVDTIYAGRKIKPIWAILNECAYSAAYAIASAAGRVTVPRTGGAGSIGAVVLHTDLTRALDKQGVTVTVIRSAERKFEGNSVEPLSDAARARMQAEVDAVADLFIATVARNRSIGAAAVRNTKAACFQAPEAVKIGLADAILAPDVAYRALVAAAS